MNNLTLITEPHQLKDLGKRCLEQKYIALDTEFMRNKTYYPVLSLIQVSAGEKVFIIDALSCTNLEHLAPILTDENLIKVFHSARQDIEVLSNYLGERPRNIFDTQIALQFCGFQKPPGYQTVVNELLGIQLNKGMQFSNWLKRPLNDKQLSYAYNDVALLSRIFPIICTKLEGKQRLSWVVQECKEQFDLLNFYPEAREFLGKFIKYFTQERDLCFALRLLEWREGKAKLYNVPRDRILTEQNIADLIKKKHKAYIPKLAARNIKEILGLLKVDYFSKEEQEAVQERIKQSSIYFKNKELYRECKALLEQVSEEVGIAKALIADKKEIFRYINGYDSKINKSWRNKVFGSLIEELILKEGQAQ